MAKAGKSLAFVFYSTSTFDDGIREDDSRVTATPASRTIRQKNNFRFYTLKDVLDLTYMFASFYNGAFQNNGEGRVACTMKRSLTGSADNGLSVPHVTGDYGQEDTYDTFYTPYLTSSSYSCLYFIYGSVFVILDYAFSVFAYKGPVAFSDDYFLFFYVVINNILYLFSFNFSRN